MNSHLETRTTDVRRRQGTVALSLLCVGLVLETGCTNPDGTANNTGTGAIAGGLLGGALGALGGGRHAGGHALFGALAGALAGGLIGNLMDREQARRLQQDAPYTYAVIQHNDYVIQQQQQPGYAPPPVPPPAVAPPAAAGDPTSPQATASPSPQLPTASQGLIPLSADDVTAMNAAGVKPDVIVKEIESSKSVFSQQDIAKIQQASPPVDSTVIDCMKSHSS